MALAFEFRGKSPGGIGAALHQMMLVATTAKRYNQEYGIAERHLDWGLLNGYDSNCPKPKNWLNYFQVPKVIPTREIESVYPKCRGYYQSPPMFYPKDRFSWYAETIRELYVFHPPILQLVNQLVNKSGFKPTDAIVHVRRTDKILESPDIPLEKYVEACQKIVPTDTRIFICSDLVKIQEELSEMLQQVGYSTARDLSEKDSVQAERLAKGGKYQESWAENLNAFKILQMFSQCQYLVGARSSYLFRCGELLNDHIWQNRDSQARTHVYSIEDNQKFGTAPYVEPDNQKIMQIDIDSAEPAQWLEILYAYQFADQHKYQLAIHDPKSLVPWKTYHTKGNLNWKDHRNTIIGVMQPERKLVFRKLFQTMLDTAEIKPIESDQVIVYVNDRFDSLKKIKRGYPQFIRDSPLKVLTENPDYPDGALITPNSEVFSQLLGAARVIGDLNIPMMQLIDIARDKIVSIIEVNLKYQNKSQSLGCGLLADNITERLGDRMIIQIPKFLNEDFQKKIRDRINYTSQRKSQAQLLRHAIKSSDSVDYLSYDDPKIPEKSQLARQKLTQGFFTYHFQRTISTHYDTCPCLVCVMKWYFNQPDVIELFEKITGETFDTYEETFVSCYSQGNFLSTHHDKSKGDYTFILSLSDPWQTDYGGNTYFYQTDQLVTPKFGVMTVFKLDANRPMNHFVSEVTVPKERWTYTGWFSVKRPVTFMMTRYVKDAPTDRAWQEAVRSIRGLYPTAPIIIIDDQSSYPPSECQFENCQIVASEYPRRGELLLYHYYLQIHPSEQAILLHDSVFLSRKVSTNCSKYRFLWHVKEDNTITQAQRNKTLKYLDQIGLKSSYSSEMKVCFGSMSVMSWQFLRELEDKYHFLEVGLDLVRDRDARIAFERVVAAVCQAEEPESDSVFGNIFEYINTITDGATNYHITYDYYLDNWHRLRADHPVTKVWFHR